MRRTGLGRTAAAGRADGAGGHARRGLVAAITGVDSDVLATAASAFRPLTSSDFPWIFVCPNRAPCF